MPISKWIAEPKFRFLYFWGYIWRLKIYVGIEKENFGVKNFIFKKVCYIFQVTEDVLNVKTFLKKIYLGAFCWYFKAPTSKNRISLHFEQIFYICRHYNLIFGPACNPSKSINHWDTVYKKILFRGGPGPLKGVS